MGFKGVGRGKTLVRNRVSMFYPISGNRERWSPGGYDVIAYAELPCAATGKGEEREVVGAPPVH